MINKFILAVKSIKNLHTLFFDYFGLLKGEVVYKLRDGIRIKARTGSTDFAEIIIIDGDSEYPSKFYPQNKKPIILDIGAHIGAFSLLIAKKLLSKDPVIFSLEPNSSSFSVLEKNIKLNEFDFIKPFKLGMTAKDGKGFLLVEGNKYDGGFVSAKKNKLRDCEEILTISLANFCKANNIATVDLMKMDIEGSEYDIFKSSIGFIKKHVKSIFIELHNIDKKNNYSSFKNDIVNYGFSVKAEIMGRTLFLINDKLNGKI